MISDCHYSNNMLALRRKINLRQIDVAIMLGQKNADQISHWEKGTALPGVINLFKLSIIYNVLPQDMYPELYEHLENDLKCENDLESASDGVLDSNPSPPQNKMCCNEKDTTP